MILGNRAEMEYKYNNYSNYIKCNNSKMKL